MPSERDALVEWTNSFNLGAVSSFDDLKDGDVLRKIVALICGKDVGDVFI